MFEPSRIPSSSSSRTQRIKFLAYSGYKTFLSDIHGVSCSSLYAESNFGFQLSGIPEKMTDPRW
jgi:hypothetical protein